MRVFVAGATGVMGRQLMPRLLEAGHRVAGMTRTESKRAELWDLGVQPVVADALDPEQVAAAVAEAQPDVIVHELTAIGVFDPRNFDRAFAATNRLRTEGTDHLLSAGQAVGVRRFVAQSYAAWPYARIGGPVKSEDDPLDATTLPNSAETFAAMTHLEDAVTEFGGIALRYGLFYGAANDGLIEPVRKRQFPIVGDGGGIMPFIHLDDAAAATVLALEHDTPAIFNIVDDDPAPAREWLPAMAEALGAKPPRKFPAWLARLFAGKANVVLATEARGASNAKAKRELGWTPRYPSWRQGFAAAYSAVSVIDRPERRRAARTSSSRV